jgi:hypothetical protein
LEVVEEEEVEVEKRWRQLETAHPVTAPLGASEVVERWRVEFAGGRGPNMLSSSCSDKVKWRRPVAEVTTCHRG